MVDLKQAMSDTAEEVGDVLDDLLERMEGPENRLLEAMRYAALGGGKRVRPFLVVASSDLFGVGRASSLRAAAAIEMIHCYSLVHDDLPAMDDDDLRRGRPTAHIVFDEATAILAGDALLTKAFEVLASPDTHTDGNVRAELCLAFAKAAGERGMVGGQMLDIVAGDHELDVAEITRLQRMKTGELISVSCETGCILGKASPQMRTVLRGYAHDIGLAFQIADDLLDVEGNAEDVGKATGKDEAAGKATFVSLLGADRAREQANILVEQAIDHLNVFGDKAVLLKDLARFIINRKS